MENEIPTSNTAGQRTLAAVVFTDGVKFSARMSSNEDYTLELIRKDLHLMKQVCDCFSGRVLKSTGDGLLMCFASAVKAVECAVEIQRSLVEAATDLPPGDALKHRIGIHLGDVFITDTDVMGNGVNIAARLQAEAEPGGICVSQTVYDVVPNSLRLETIYLGQRELKNIAGTIPAYRIHLPFVPHATDPYERVADNLNSHPDLLRIKKLIFYTCKNRWENDQFKLEELYLRNLVRELHQLAPTQERLKVLLHDVVKTLSKQMEYKQIADTITTEFTLLYHNPSEETLIVANPSLKAERSPLADPQSPSATSLYGEVAQQLEQHENAIRVKKLIFYTCKRRWENDATVLQQSSLETLLQDLRERHPTLQSLQTALEDRVKTLSKKAEYSQIANLIVRHASSLYPLPVEEADIPTLVALAEAQSSLQGSELDFQPNQAVRLYDRIADEIAQHASALRVKKLIFSACKNRWENDQDYLDNISLSDLLQELKELNPTLEQLQSLLGGVVQTLNKQAEYQLIANTILEKMGELYIEIPEPVALVVDSSTANPSVAEALPTLNPSAHESSQLKLIELVDLRLQIMKYANPLRAKIILFSAVHHTFSFNQQDWLDLKTYELEGLLHNLLNACETIEQFESRLSSREQSWMEPEETAQTIAAIVRAVRPFYNQFSNAEKGHSLTEYLAQQTQILGTVTQMVTPVTDEEGEYTCQLFSNPTRSPATSHGDNQTQAIGQVEETRVAGREPIQNAEGTPE